MYRTNIKSIPSSVGDLKKLEKLSASSNQIYQIPNVGQLKKLIRLWVSGNQLRQLPKGLGKLEYLSISNNKLSKLPDEIGRLKNLKDIDANKNEISRLPVSIGQLKKLQYLRLSQNRIVELPDEMSSLISLLSLDLSYNRLTELNPAIVKLSGLVRLYLTHNRIYDLPKGIGKMKELEILKLDDNYQLDFKNVAKRFMQYKGRVTISTDKIYFNEGEISILIPCPCYSGKSIKKLNNIYKLELIGCDLVNIPKPTSRLKRLEILSLYDNKLTEVPDIIYKSASLKEVDCSYNPIDTVKTEAICALEELEKLNLKSTLIDIKEIHALKKCIPKAIYSESKYRKMQH